MLYIITFWNTGSKKYFMIYDNYQPLRLERLSSVFRSLAKKPAKLLKLFGTETRYEEKFSNLCNICEFCGDELNTWMLEI